jgi:MFS family permease
MAEHQAQIPRNRRPFISLLTATGLAWFGNVVTLIVVPWFVYQLTGSAAQTGLVGFAASVPLVLAGAFGGVFIDRLGHARTAAIAELFSGFFLALIPILFWTAGLNIWIVVSLVFASNLFSAPGMTARKSLIPEVASAAKVSLERANSLDQLLSRLSMLIGPPVAGILMAVFDPVTAILVTVGSVWLAGLVVRLGVPQDAPRESETESTYLGDLVEGFRFLIQDPLMRALAFILALTNLLEAPLSIIAPIYADRVLGGEVDLGLIIAALGAGLMLGVVGYATFGSRLPRRLVFITGMIGIGSSYWILATLPGLYGTMAVLFCLGLVAGPVNPLLATVSQERVPANMRGRVFGLIAAIALSMMPIGRLAGGVMIEWIGLAGTMLIQAIGFAFCGVLLFLLPALKLLNEPHTVSEGAEEPTPAPAVTSRVR